MTFLGVGTKFYGKSKYNLEDKSYITTKWFSLNLIPLFPIKSYRIIKEPKPKGNFFRFTIVSEDFGFGIKDNFKQFKILEEIPLKNNIKQFLITYIFYYGGMGLCILSYFLIPVIPVISLLVICIYIIAILINSKS